MIEQLTPEQEALIPVIRDKWINLALNSGKQVTIPEIKDGINWIYKKAKLNKPLIIITPSPDYAQLTANFLKNINPKFLPELLKQLKKKYRKIGANVWDNVGDNVGDNVWDNVGANVKTTELEFFPVYEGLDWSSGWLSIYDYFETLGFLKDKDFETYRDVFVKGIWNCIMFENVCIVSMLPSKVLRDESGRLHSITEASVQFSDGSGHYTIYGVRFKKELWESITSRKLPVRDVLQLQNIEQRYIALQHYGFENMLDELNAKLIHKSKRGNELFEIPFKTERETIKLKLLRYSCPSTDRVYGSFVPPEITKADQAMAWKHNMTEDEYEVLKIEA